MPPPKIRCPQCGALAEYSPVNAFRPFCSERCKMIDLGAWASDQYAVPGKPLEGDDFQILGGDPQSHAEAPDTSSH
ncbi:MAG TPA: DNA gyrase inhibitor YacG [Usitatibacteraceae bacterium]